MSAPRLLADAWVQRLPLADLLVETQVGIYLGVPNPRNLGKLLDLLGPVAALQVYGPADEMERTADALRALPGKLPTRYLGDEDTGEIQRDLQGHGRMIALVRETTDRLREAERVLEEAGWAYDPRDGKVKRTGAGNRPYAWRRKLAVAVAMDLDPDGVLRNTVEVRRKVSEALGRFLASEEVDPRSGGFIDNDIRNELKKRAPTS